MTDNRYGTLFKYGASPMTGGGHKYGVSSTGEREGLAWGIEVDWDGDGAFDGVNESAYMLKAPTIKRGRRTMLRPAGQGFESIRTGQATIVLSNHDGRYDAWNTSSPLYPNVESGKDIRIRVRDLSTGTIYYRFYGIIQDIVPSGYDTDAIVTIYADDAMRVLRDTYVTERRSYPDGTLAPQNIDDLVTIILDAIQWPARWGRIVYDTANAIRYWYANGDRSAGAELEDLALSFFGYLGVWANGNLFYVPKNKTISPAVASISQSELLKDIGNPQPWSIRRNVVKLRYHVRKRSDNVVVWQPLEDDPAIESGETKSYFVEYTHDGYPAFLEGLEQLFSFTRIQGIAEPSASYNVTTSVTDYGIKAFVSFTNNEAFPLYLYVGDPITNPTTGDATYLRGDITWTEKAETISSPRDPSSVANQRVLVLDSLWYQNKDQAFALVDNYQDFISQLHKTPIIQIENRFALQFTPDLFLTITVDIPALGINSEDFRVGGIEEEAIGETTQAVRTTFYLEPFIQPISGVATWGSGATWDVSKWGW